MKYAFVDYRISEEEFKNLSNLNCNIIKCEPCFKLYDAIYGHPDILLHFINSSTAILHKEASEAFEASLRTLGIKVIRSQYTLTDTYPEDIILNAVNTKDFFMHNLKYSDPVLLEAVKDKTLIDIKQGYAKCSTAVLSDKAFITSDKSIFKTLTIQGCDVLLINPGSILLPGLDYGFIGGTCGMLDSNTLVFYGSLEYHPQKQEIYSFLKRNNITPVYLSDTPLMDRGSILFIDL